MVVNTSPAQGHGAFWDGVFSKGKIREFPNGPVVRTPRFHLGAVPGQGINIPQAMRYGQKKRKILQDIMADQVLKCANTMLIREKNNAGWEGHSESGRPRQGH